MSIEDQVYGAPLTAEQLIARMRLRDDGELEQLLARVCKEHHVTPEELFTNSRQFAKARHAAWRALYETGHWSMNRISFLFDTSDHTTIHYAIRGRKGKAA